MSARSRRDEYFPAEPGAPAPLVHDTTRFVRFEEVDLMGVVWHGRYPSYFEDGRMRHGEQYGVGYLDFINASLRAPVVQMRLDYVAPLKFGDSFTIRTRLHWTDAVKLNYSFEIIKEDGGTAARGCSTQLFIDADDEVYFVRPPLVERLCERWQAGEFDVS